jgi:SAM-dependent methyltransferase
MPLTDALRADLSVMDPQLLHQLLQNRFRAGQSVLDAGCGYGANLRYLLRLPLRLTALDPDRPALAAVRRLPEKHPAVHATLDCVEARIEDMRFGAGRFDVVLCLHVLHYVEDHAAFEQQCEALWRVLKPGGWCLWRMATSQGLQDDIRPLGSGEDGWYRLPDGSNHYLATPSRIEALASRWEAGWLTPLQVDLLPGQRALLSCLLQKPG